MGFFLDFIRSRRQALIASLTGSKRPSPKPIVYKQTSSYEKQYEAAKKSPTVTMPAPNEPALGLDWAQSHSIQVPRQGYREDTPKIVVNRGSSVVGLKPFRTYAPSEIQETRRVLSFEGTDIKPTPRSKGTISWDGIVRNTGTRPSYLTTPRTVSNTHPEKPITRDPYSFY